MGKSAVFCGQRFFLLTSRTNRIIMILQNVDSASYAEGGSNLNILDRFSLAGKKALVLAPQYEYGADIAEGLREAGAEIFLCGDDKAALERIAAETGAEGIFEYRRGTKAEADALASFIRETMGGIDVFVDNGSGKRMEGWFHSYADIAQNFADTQRGLILTVQAVGTIMAEQGRGSVIFVSDYAALVGCDVHNYDGCPEEMEKDFSVGYGYVKGSYVNYARQAAGYLGEAGCRCNTIAFAPMAGTKPAAFEEAFTKHSHIRRMAASEDVKAIAVFLASDASAYITGTTIPVDGGYCAK